ncbi:MAG TPA: hypothetical protein GXZ40_00195 [Bacteroidales bacterium]|nr:hypothetical protein [Bacteroidales bacterium]
MYVLVIFFIFHFPSTEGFSSNLACVRAQVESPQGYKPLGTRRQKSDFRSSFCRLATPRLVPADLEPETDPERSEGARPKEK